MSWYLFGIGMVVAFLGIAVGALVTGIQVGGGMLFVLGLFALTMLGFAVRVVVDMVQNDRRVRALEKK